MICPHPYGLACKNPHTHELLQPLAYACLKAKDIHQGYRESNMLNMSTFMSFCLKKKSNQFKTYENLKTKINLIENISMY
jgi:hypothetical protein